MTQAMLDLDAPRRTKGRDEATRKRTLGLIGLIAQMGSPKLASALLEFAEEADEPLTKDAEQRRFLEGPLVVHQSAWNEDCPKWMHGQAITERYAIVAGELPGHIVGPTEIACVMFGAMMDAPRGSEVTNIYLWACRHAVERHYGKDRPQAASARDTAAGLTDEQYLTEGGRWHNGYYREFASEIRRKVVRHCQLDARADRKQNTVNPKPEPPPTRPIVAEQLALLV